MKCSPAAGFRSHRPSNLNNPASKRRGNFCIGRVLLLEKIYFVCRLRTGKCYFEEVPPPEGSIMTKTEEVPRAVFLQVSDTSVFLVSGCGKVTSSFFFCVKKPRICAGFSLVSAENHRLGRWFSKVLPFPQDKKLLLYNKLPVTAGNLTKGGHVMTNDLNKLSHTSWNCKYHIVFAPKYRRQVFYRDKRVEIGKSYANYASGKG